MTDGIQYNGSIYHTGNSHDDSGHRRVLLYFDDGRILANDGEAQFRPDVDRPRDLEHTG